MRPQSGGVPHMISMLAAFLTASVVAGVLAAGLALPAVGVAGVSTRAGVNLFESLPSDMTVTPLAQQSVMLDKDGKNIATLYSEKRIVVPLDQVSKTMQHAQVAIEDERFYEHSGIDMRGTIRAFVQNSTADSTQGGSTLTQQYVKLQLLEGARRSSDKAELLRLSSRSGVTGYVRKMRELKYAVALEKKYSKEQILQGYLNMVFFGDRTYGVEAAANHYFGVHAKDLNLTQSALLAGLVQSPSGMNPVRKPELAKKRRNVVLGNMLRNKYITRAEYDNAVKADLGLNLQKTEDGGNCMTSKFPYFCSYVSAWLTKQPSLGKTPQERNTMISRGGLTIQTTLDSAKTEQMDKILKAKVPPNDPSKFLAGGVTLDPRNGNVIAMTQSSNYANTASKGTTMNITVDKQYNGTDGFQYGSTQKYFSIITALEQGRKWNSTVDVPVATRQEKLDNNGNPTGKSVYVVDFADKINGVPCGEPGHWQVQNHDEADYSGTQELKDITAKSINTAFAQLNSELGWCKVQETTTKLGVHTADRAESPIGYKNGKPSGVPAAVTLGSASVSPMNVAQSYGVMAGQGKLCQASPVLSLKDVRGKTYALPTEKERCKQVITPEVALDATKIFSEVTETYGYPMDNKQPTAGKSGTDDFRDRTWFAGVTPTYATVVLVGPLDPLKQPVGNITIGGKFYDNFLSSSLAGPLWHEIMNMQTKNDPVTQFTLPLNANIKLGEQKQIPDVRGMDPDQAAQTLRAAGFQSTQGAPTFETEYAVGKVGNTSPAPLSTAATGSTVQLNVVGESDGAPVPENQPARTPATVPQRTYSNPRPAPRPTARPTPAPPPPAPTFVYVTPPPGRE